MSSSEILPSQQTALEAGTKPRPGQFSLETSCAELLGAQQHWASTLGGHRLEPVGSQGLVLRCWLWILAGINRIHH